MARLYHGRGGSPLGPRGESVAQHTQAQVVDAQVVDRAAQMRGRRLADRGQVTLVGSSGVR